VTYELDKIKAKATFTLIVYARVCPQAHL
jgi:hypothetical protein